MKLSVVFFLMCFFCFQLGTTQESSREHKVVKGETVYQISRKYNVTVNEIFQLNPGATDGINVDDILIIPDTQSVNSPSTHIVKPGETKFGLSKAYGISIAELERRNPHIVNGLQAGHRLQLDGLTSSNYNQPEQVTNTTTYNSYKTHKVLKGETLYGISRANGLTVDQLVSSNSDVLNGVLKTGTVLKIPTYEEVKETTDDAVFNGTYLVKKGDTKYSLSKKFNVTIAQLESQNPEIVSMLKTGMTIVIPGSTNNSTVENVTKEATKQPINQVVTDNTKTDMPTSEASSNIIDLTKSFNRVNKKVLFVTPFANSDLINEAESLKSNSTFTDEQIKQYVAFYRGAQIAIDSARALGLNFELNLEAVKSLSKRFEVANPTDELNDYNLVFSPFDKKETEEIAIAALRANIPVVTTSANQESKNLANLFEAFPSTFNKRNAIISHLNKTNGNIIVLNDPDRTETKEFIEENCPKASFVRISRRGAFRASDLSDLLSKDQTNYILINSDKNRVFLHATNILMSESTNYAIQLAVIDPDLLPDEEYVSTRRYKVLNMIYPTVQHIEVNSSTDQFATKFANLYKTTATNYAKYGFDLMFDSLLRVCQPSGFTSSASREVTQYTILNFNYQKNELERYSNRAVSIQKYEANSIF